MLFKSVNIIRQAISPMYEGGARLLYNISGRRADTALQLLCSESIQGEWILINKPAAVSNGIFLFFRFLDTLKMKWLCSVVKKVNETYLIAYDIENTPR